MKWVMGILVLLLIFSTITVFSDEQLPEAEHLPGQMTAEGKGNCHLAILEGDVSILGKGILTVSKNALIEITGETGTTRVLGTQEFPLISYSGFSGEAKITGDAYSVDLRSSEVKIAITGIGNARLAGKGTYQISGTQKKKPDKGIWQKMADPGEKTKSPPPLYFGTVKPAKTTSVNQGCTQRL